MAADEGKRSSMEHHGHEDGIRGKASMVSRIVRKSIAAIGDVLPTLHDPATAGYEVHHGHNYHDDRRGSADSLGLPKRQMTEPELKQGLFLDSDQLKEKVRQHLLKPKYNVQDFYKTGGWAVRVSTSHLFGNITLGVIGFNAIWIAIDTDMNDAEMLADADPVFQVAENLFCAFFSFEWVVRFLSFRRKRDGCRDAWFVFDTILVFTMVMEVWAMPFAMLIIHGGSGGGGGMGNTSILRVARLLRLSRMARVARLLRAMPELMIMIKGMLSATRSVFFTLCLLVIIMYVFGIAFTQLCQGTPLEPDYFSSVTHSMYTLLLYGTFLDDIGTLAKKIGKESYVYGSVFFIFVLLTALTVMNMLIGVLCEVVSAVAATEKEEMLVNFVNVKLKKVVEVIDTDGSGMLSKKEFMHILDSADAVKALNDVGVDVIGLVDFADHIFHPDNHEVEPNDEGEVELSFQKFMEVVLQLRGTNIATVKDVVDLRKFVRQALEETTRKMDRVQKEVIWQSDGIRQIAKLTKPDRGPKRIHLGDAADSTTSEMFTKLGKAANGADGTASTVVDGRKVAVVNDRPSNQEPLVCLGKGVAADEQTTPCKNACVTASPGTQPSQANGVSPGVCYAPCTIDDLVSWQAKVQSLLDVSPWLVPDQPEDAHPSPPTANGHGLCPSTIKACEQWQCMLRRVVARPPWVLLGPNDAPDQAGRHVDGKAPPPAFGSKATENHVCLSDIKMEEAAESFVTFQDVPGERAALPERGL